MKYIVVLEYSTFIAPWSGDPGRTDVKDNAKRYDSMSAATYALAYARRYHDYKDAYIVEVLE